MTQKEFIKSGQYLIKEVEKRAEKGAKYFFSPDAMRFFSSRICQLCWKKDNDIFFVTSEKNGNSYRKYTIRKSSTSGDITTMGEFQAYDTINEANMAIREIIEVVEN